MLVRMQPHTESDDELIARYMEPHRYKRGRANWRLVETGTPIWVFANALEGYRGDLARLAADYDLSPAQVDAALAYYERYRDIVDDRRISNAEFELLT